MREALRAKILATANPKPVPIDLPDWSGAHVRPLLVGDMESFGKDADPKLANARNIARVLCTAEGELIFDVTDADDLALIAGLPLKSVKAINDAVDRQTLLTEHSVVELGNVLPPAIDSSSI